MVQPNNRVFPPSNQDNSTENESQNTSTPKTTPKLINNRQDVVKILNEICRWYKEHELSNPIIYDIGNCKFYGIPKPNWF